MLPILISCHISPIQITMFEGDHAAHRVLCGWGTAWTNPGWEGFSSVRCSGKLTQAIFLFLFLLLSLFFEPILVEKDLVQCDVQVNLSKQDFHLSKDIGRSIVKESPTSWMFPSLCWRATNCFRRTEIKLDCLSLSLSGCNLYLTLKNGNAFANRLWHPSFSKLLSRKKWKLSFNHSVSDFKITLLI